MITSPLRILPALVIVVAGALIPFGAARSAHGQAPHQPSVASPSLVFSRLYGGTETEQNAAIALGKNNTFLAGTTSSPDWPAHWSTPCTLQTCPHGFVLKLRNDGDFTWYGLSLGGSGSTQINAIAVDRIGNAYVTGTTTSRDYPLLHAFQAHCKGTPCNDGFITKISPSGRIVYSTFLGGRGEDTPTSIELDGRGDVYVAGETSSPDFPTSHATQPHLAGATDGFVTKLDASGRRLLYSTYLGGKKGDRISSIAIDRLGEAYVTGQTYSPDFRTSAHAVMPRFIGGNCTFFGCGDGFVVKLGTAGRFLRSTVLGTPADDSGNAIALDGHGNVYVAGYTGNAVFPTTAVMPPTGKVLCGSEGVVAPCESAFVVELTPSLTGLLYSRLLSGDGEDSADAIAVNALGNVVVAGYTESTTFPTVNPSQRDTGGGPCEEAKANAVPCDGFVAVIGPHNSRVRFSTYLGGNGIDDITSLALNGLGSAYLAGISNSTNFPAATGITTSPLPKAFFAVIQELYR